MITEFQPQKFLRDYKKWSRMTFPREEAHDDDVYDLRYDLYEVDTNYAGSWIRLVESNFKDVDLYLKDKDLMLLRDRARALLPRIDKNDAEIVGKYIDRLDIMISMYANYKHLQN